MELYRTESSSGYSGAIDDIYETEVPVCCNAHDAYTQIKGQEIHTILESALAVT
jgi:hypothetical protein